METSRPVPDRLVLRRLELPCRVGADPGENRRPQPLWIGLEVETDLEVPAGTDRLGDTVDYAAVADAVQRVTGRERPFQLLEAVAHGILREVLGLDGIRAATVSVEKARPPLGDAIGTITVRMRRELEAMA